MKRFLIIKHWQLFILIFVIPLIIEGFKKDFIHVVPMISEVIPSLNVSISMKVITLIFKFMASGLLMWWIWTLGINLYLKVSHKIKHNINRFKTTFFASILGLPLGFTIHSFLNPNYGFLELLLFCILAIILFCCYLYCIHFITTLINSVESGDVEIPKRQYDKDFVLFFIYPLGIWFLQPRINKIFKE